MTSQQVKFEEMRHEFLKFANFFLLVKRPYGFNENVKPFMENKGVRGYTIHSNSDLGKNTSTSAEFCGSTCEKDMNCNAWKYEDNEKTCTKYKIDSLNQIKTSESVFHKVGYKTHKDDAWAVTDLSGLPTKKEFFKNVAKMVLLLQPKNSALSKRANSILKKDSIQYCYETEPVSDENKLEDYMNMRKNALDSLEESSLYFLYPEAQNKNQLQMELSLAIAKVLKYLNLGGPHGHLFTNSNKNSDYVNTIQSNILALASYAADYENTRKLFMLYDCNKSGYITREEFKSYMVNNPKEVCEQLGLTQKINGEACVDDDKIEAITRIF